MRASPLANYQLLESLEVSSGDNSEPLDRLLYWLSLTMLIKPANSEMEHTHPISPQLRKMPSNTSGSQTEGNFPQTMQTTKLSILYQKMLPISDFEILAYP